MIKQLFYSFTPGAGREVLVCSTMLLDKQYNYFTENYFTET
jgi:hypothetical protein